ncbi:MAG: hypothetical protein FE78DRAFT_543632, partial [Acidomyces sp. 'richmondensis']
KEKKKEKKGRGRRGEERERREKRNNFLAGLTMVSSQFTRCISCGGDGRLVYYRSIFGHAVLRPLSESNNFRLVERSLASNVDGGGIYEDEGPLVPDVAAEGQIKYGSRDIGEEKSEMHGDGSGGDNRPGIADNVDEWLQEILSDLPDEMSGIAAGRNRTEREEKLRFTRSQKKKAEILLGIIR